MALVSAVGEGGAEGGVGPGAVATAIRSAPAEIRAPRLAHEGNGGGAKKAEAEVRRPAVGEAAPCRDKARPSPSLLRGADLVPGRPPGQRAVERGDAAVERRRPGVSRVEVAPCMGRRSGRAVDPGRSSKNHAAACGASREEACVVARPRALRGFPKKNGALRAYRPARWSLVLLRRGSRHSCFSWRVFWSIPRRSRLGSAHSSTHSPLGVYIYGIDFST